MRFSYRCSLCGREYPISPELLLCEDCSRRQRADRPLSGILEVVLEGAAPADWEIADLLPVEREWFPPIPVGNTPLWEPERLRRSTGFPALYLKDDSCNPTGSLKDRASYLVAAFARREGIERIVVASTGNAGSSMCGVGAAAGLAVRLYLPDGAPAGKLVQSLQYGADVVQVDGTYDEASAEAMEYLRTHGGLSRNTGHNPLTIEGKKTVALEVFRQLGGRVPDYVFVSTGDGVILSGVYKGFEDLVSLGIAGGMPTVVAVQAEGSQAITQALESGDFSDPVPSATLADSISVDVPAAGFFAVERLRRHGGRAVTVSDEAILSAQTELASGSGLFAEPAAAAAWAGFRAMEAEIPRDAAVVVLVTGNGLKDVESAKKGVGIR
jgi:threonine synthase